MIPLLRRAGALGGRLGATLRHAARGRGRALALGAAGLAVLPPLAFGAWTWHTAAGVDLARPQDASVVYAAGLELAAGLSVEAADLAGTLRRLGYREVPGPPGPGQFRRDAEAWDLHLRAREDPRATRPALAVRLSLDGPRVAGLATPEGQPLEAVELEPEPLAGLGGPAGQIRRPLPLAAFPPHLVAAVLAMEDRRFHEHRGVDVRGVLRALWVNLRRGEYVQGGSTITQQLVKNLVLTPKRTWSRKLREAAIALWLERRYSKAEILEAYLNGIYVGQHGSLSLYGLGAAARGYLGKDVERVSLAEAALLAGLIRAPNTYSPVHHPGRARERRDLVLRRMRALGLADGPRVAAALREPLRVEQGPPPRLLGPYFVEHVRVQVEGLGAAEELPEAGLRIYTTLDPVLQRAAEAAVARGLDRLEGGVRHLRRREAGARLQAALVALDPRTGEIRALVGGRDYAASQFNRATQARRQPGSAFKPFVYLAALGWGPRGEPPHFTPLSRLEDRPLTVGRGRQAWSPRNFENRYQGTVTVREALEQSLNAATVWMAESVGLDAVVAAARAAGITSPLAPVPALTLGSFEVSPLELAAAYAPFANGGQPVAPTALRAVVDREGGVRLPARPAPAAALRGDEAFLVAHLLQGVVDRGTGAAARALGVAGPVAAKTGTSNDGRDAWFVGFTPRLVALVWVGFDQRDVLRLSAAQAALPLWADFMRTALAVLPAGPLAPPEGVVFRDVDPATGRLATAWCPLAVREAFLASTEPREACGEHGPAHLLPGLVRRLLDALGTGAHSDR